MRNVLLLLTLATCSLASTGCKDKYGDAMKLLVAEQKLLDSIDVRLKEFDKEIAAREQEMKANELLSGHPKKIVLTPEQLKMADDQLNLLKRQHEQLPKSYRNERLELYKKQLAQETAVENAELAVKEAQGKLW